MTDQNANPSHDSKQHIKLSKHLQQDVDCEAPTTQLTGHITRMPGGIVRHGAAEDEGEDVCSSTLSNLPTAVSLPEQLASQLPPPTAPQNLAASDPLSEIQKLFSLIYIAGSVYVVDRQELAKLSQKGPAQKFVAIKRTEATLLITREIAKLFPGEDPKPIVLEFFKSPVSLCYSGVEFNPTGSSTGKLNLWVGPTAIPAKGCSQLIRNHLLYVICDGNKEHYRYLLKYLAHALQRPWEKPGVMVILLGGQGAGKGMLARILRKIWSATYLHVHQIKSITGEFNASLERAYIVWLDEAFFSGNRIATDSLKSLVTEPVIHINEKHQPARQIESFHRFFGASNSDFYKATDRDDRRDFVLRVSESRKGDYAYWTALKHEIENGGVEDLVRGLLKQDLSLFNVREKPNTNELMRQKLNSLSPIQNWWHDCLCKGEFNTGGGWPAFVSTEFVIKGICECSGGKVSQKPKAIEVANLLKAFCPSSTRKQQTHEGTRQRGVLLPPLKLARAEFATYMGGEMTW